MPVGQLVIKVANARTKKARQAVTCLSWSRCSCGTWWACSPGSSRPGQWWPRAGCYHDWRWPAGGRGGGVCGEGGASRGGPSRLGQCDSQWATPGYRQVGSGPGVTFTICCFSVGVTKSPRTSLTTCLRFVACDIINGGDQLLPPAGDNTETYAGHTVAATCCSTCLCWAEAKLCGYNRQTIVIA